MTNYVVKMSQPIQLRIQLRKSQATQMRKQLRQRKAKLRKKDHQASKKERTSSILHMQNVFHEQEVGGENIIKCGEWFHDTYLVKAVPEQYWIPPSLSVPTANRNCIRVDLRIDLHRCIDTLLCGFALCLYILHT